MKTLLAVLLFAWSHSQPYAVFDDGNTVYQARATAIFPTSMIPATKMPIGVRASAGDENVQLVYSASFAQPGPSGTASPPIPKSIIPNSENSEIESTVPTTVHRPLAGSWPNDEVGRQLDEIGTCDVAQGIKTKLQEASVKLNARQLTAEQVREAFNPLGMGIDDISFWGMQLVEHALFLHVALQEPDISTKTIVTTLKEEALSLHQDWKVWFYDRWLGPNPLQALSELPSLIERLTKFKIHVIELSLNAWIGFVTPSLGDHFLRELLYLRAKICMPMVNPLLELAFWMEDDYEHVQIQASRIDWREELLLQEAGRLATKARDLYSVHGGNTKPITSASSTILTPSWALPGVMQQLQASVGGAALESMMSATEAAQIFASIEAFSRKLSVKLAQRTVTSDLHPLVNIHIIRETDRALETLHGIGKHLREAVKAAKMSTGAH